jgi:hypothetical protein
VQRDGPLLRQVAAPHGCARDWADLHTPNDHHLRLFDRELSTVVNFCPIFCLFSISQDSGRRPGEQNLPPHFFQRATTKRQGAHAVGSVILLKLAMVTCGVLLLLLLLAQLATAAAITGSPQSQCQFEVAPRFSALTSERTTELVVRLLQVPQHPAQFVCTAAINATAVIVAAATIRAGDRRLLVPVHGLRSFLPLTNSSASVVRAELRCTLGGGSGAPRPLVLVRHPPHPNEVKVDAWTLGLVADGLPFFPFGAYVEWPTRGAEYEEAEAGLNTFLPTHGTDLNGRSPADRADMLEFMDTAARLGLRVVYQISGVADANNSDPKKWAVLEAEVTAVRRHPALLGWYLADEPDGSGVDPARLSAAYQRVKQLDPYHPVMVSEPTNLATNQPTNQPTC